MAGQQALALLMGVRILLSQNSDPERHHASQGPRFGMSEVRTPTQGWSLREQTP
jgi:hypothetical protein